MIILIIKYNLVKEKFKNLKFGNFFIFFNIEYFFLMRIKYFLKNGCDFNFLIVLFV